MYYGRKRYNVHVYLEAHLVHLLYKAPRAPGAVDNLAADTAPARSERKDKRRSGEAA
jgi:hypothetical protein